MKAVTLFLFLGALSVSARCQPPAAGAAAPAVKLCKDHCEHDPEIARTDPGFQTINLTAAEALSLKQAVATVNASAQPSHLDVTVAHDKLKFTADTNAVHANATTTALSVNKDLELKVVATPNAAMLLNQRIAGGIR